MKPVDKHNISHSSYSSYDHKKDEKLSGSARAQQTRDEYTKSNKTGRSSTTPTASSLPDSSESLAGSTAKASSVAVPKVATTHTINVSNQAQLKEALSAAKPGDNIVLAAGTYAGPVSLQGKQGVTISGSTDAVIDTSSKTAPSFLVDNCQQCTITGLTIKGGQKGLMVTHTQDSVFDKLDVSNTQMEGVHFKENSSGNVLQASSVHDTGLGGSTSAGHGRTQAEDGEGVYVGTAKSNDASGDPSNNNQILNNHVYNNTAENIDIKEFTSGGVISGNILDGSKGGSGATANVAIKGSNYKASNNTITHPIAGGIRSFQVAGVPNSGSNNDIDQS